MNPIAVCDHQNTWHTFFTGFGLYERLVTHTKLFGLYQDRAFKFRFGVSAENVFKFEFYFHNYRYASAEQTIDTSSADHGTFNLKVQTERCAERSTGQLSPYYYIEYINVDVYWSTQKSKQFFPIALIQSLSPQKIIQLEQRKIPLLDASGVGWKYLNAGDKYINVNGGIWR